MPHDLGVLFVHGIGDQARGATLVDFGTPLLRWITARSEQLGGSAAIERAMLTPDADAPAHADLRISQGTEARSWRFAETWWAESFAVRPFRELARWSFSVIPWTFGSHYARRLYRALTAPRGRGWRVASWLMGVVSAFLTMLAGIGLSVLMLGVFFVLLTLGLIPWQRLRAAIQRLQVRLASTIGDSFVLVNRPIESAAIISRFRRDLDWMCRECNRVAVVAHSQGAAVATLALHAELPPRVRLLVTFGSGLRKLQELMVLEQARSLRRSATLTTIGLVIVALVALYVVAFFFSPRTVSLGDPTLWMMAGYAALGLSLLGSGVVDFVRVPDPAAIRSIATTFRAAQLVWEDYYASLDPVPNGKLQDSATLPPTSVEVVNRGSMLRDHTSYWTNNDGFVARVASALLAYDSPAIVAPLSPEAAAYLSEQRRPRVTMRRAIGWISIASAAALVAKYYMDWLPVLAFVTTYLSNQLAELFGGSVAVSNVPSPGNWWRPLGWLSVVLAACGIAAALWSAYDRRATEKPPPHRSSGESAIPVITAVWLQLIVVALALNEGNMPPFWVFMSLLIAPVILLRPWASPPLPAELRNAPSPPVEEKSRAEKAWQLVSGLLRLAVLPIGLYLLVVSSVRWAQAAMRRVFGVEQPNVFVAAALALAVFVGLSLALGALATAVKRRKTSPAPSTPEQVG